MRRSWPRLGRRSAETTGWPGPAAGGLRRDDPGPDHDSGRTVSARVDHHADRCHSPDRLCAAAGFDGAACTASGCTGTPDLAVCGSARLPRVHGGIGEDISRDARRLRPAGERKDRTEDDSQSGWVLKRAGRQRRLRHLPAVRRSGRDGHDRWVHATCAASPELLVRKR